MLLDLIILVFTWMGIMFNLIPMFIDDPIFKLLPFNLIGIIFFVCAIGIVRWRGSNTTAWLLMDFPSTNSEEKLAITCDGPKIYLQKLQKSIATFLKNKKDWYYRDGPDAPMTFGGHDTRLVDSETAYCINPEKALFVNKLEQDFYDYGQVKDVVKKEMQSMKNKQGTFLLTGENSALDIDEIDIEENTAHKDLFEHILDHYFINVHGRTFTLKNYHRFQDKQAAPYQIGSVVHYIKALSAMRAAGVKKAMGNWSKWIIIIAVIAIIVIVMMLLATGVIKLPTNLF